MIDLDKIEALAKAATPGPWFAQDQHADNGEFSHVGVETVDGMEIIGEGIGPNSADTRFIAAANPAAILELIAATHQRETALAEMQGRMGGLLLVQAGLVNALQVARDGLVWYHETCPEYVDCSDWEALQQIDAALAAAGVTL